MSGIDDRLSMDLAEKKITNARRSGADYLCTACPYCQLQFDRNQKMLVSERNEVKPLPAILFTQLLGLCLGLDEQALGLEQNALKATGIMKFLQ